MNIAEKLTTIAENEQKVYDAGKRDEYKRFWDEFQQNGNRKDYSFAVGGVGWTVENFKPKYDIIPTGSAAYMFRNIPSQIDLVEYFEQLGIALDLSNVTNFNYALCGNHFTRLGEIDTRNAAVLTGIFNNCQYLHTVDKLILKSDGSQTITASFDLCPSLENIIIEGKFGKSVSFTSSQKLTHDSLMSVIDALYDYSDTSTTHNCTLGTTNLAKLTDAEKAIATQKGWTLA